MTYDVLGRPFKTESLNMDQTHTVYATRTDTYNVRDQITSIFVQQGTNGTGQQTSMTYDGHGRLSTRKTPIEDSPGTTYLYNADDTVQKVTDARGASSTYTYNGRQLITLIHYAKPGGSAPTVLPNAPDVTFTYDQAGNRLSMTDGLGSMNYAYDTWSRLTSETRYFTDLAASYSLSYEYNIAGGLTKIYDSYNGTISYAFNSAGQVTGVTGTHYAGVTQFASGMQYRAWGGLKHATYFNSGSFDLSYNGRLQMTHYGGGLGSDFQYYADGRVKFASSTNGNNTFDRSYAYDQVGRLTQALTGKEARGENGVDGPYKQSYSFNVWDNMTSRNNRFWSQPDDLFTATYVNDRSSSWQHNASGNVTQDTLHHVYDSAGRQTSTDDGIGVMSIAQDYDGDGQPGKRVENRPGLTSAITTYYVRSSLLVGQVVTELITTGFRAGTHNTHLYVNGSQLALYDSWLNVVIGKLSNPVTGSGWQELDPLGGYVGFADPFVQNPNTTYDSLHPNEALYLEDGNPFDPGGGCTLDGLPVSCGWAAGRAASGAAVEAPLRDAIPVWFKGELTLAFFQAFADGYAGYVPGNARYAGEGHIRSINPPKLVQGGYHPDTNLAALNGVGGSDDPQVVLARGSSLPAMSTRSDADQKLVWDVAYEAGELLNNLDCARYLAGFRISATALKETFQKMSQLGNVRATQNQKEVGYDRSGNPAVASTQPGLTPSSTVIRLGPVFLKLGRVGGAADYFVNVTKEPGPTRLGQQLVMLHELGHAAGSLNAIHGGPKTLDEYNEGILRNCFGIK
jgi:YD repeat-containing protein